MRERTQGVVVMQAIVGVDGSITRSRVVKPLHPELDEQALIAVKQWGFAPGTRDGRPVPVLVNIEMTFTLKDRR
jgi:protein TonB